MNISNPQYTGTDLRE